MKLVICEKPSVGAAVAAALGVREKKDGYIEGNGYVISWCIGHLVGLAEAAAYGEQYRKWSYDSLPMRNGSFTPLTSIFKTKKLNRVIKWQEKR